MSPDPWLRRFRPTTTARARLVCFPHAGGSASFYLPVAAALSPRADVVAVQYPGRQDRHAEPPLTDVGALADEVAGRLRFGDGLPLFLFGHSLGASVAFEVARRLERRGPGPARLFVSGRRAPSVFRESHVHRLDDAGLLDEIRGLDGTSSVVLADEDLMRAALPALRADYRAAELYRGEPGVAVAAPVTALAGDADPHASLDDVAAWGKHTTGGFGLRLFPGGHFFVSERLEDVIGLLGDHLAPPG